MLVAVLCALALAMDTGVRFGPADRSERPAPSALCEALAGRLRVAPGLQPVIVDMCRRAPTFRQQMARVAQAPGLVVTIEAGPVLIGGRVRASTEITRVDGQVCSAAVRILGNDSRLAVELVAHEFEHILEQLDGVDLARWVGHSGVYRVGGDDRGPIETERARQVGRLVAGEYAAADVETTASRIP